MAGIGRVEARHIHCGREVIGSCRVVGDPCPQFGYVVHNVSVEVGLGVMHSVILHAHHAPASFICCSYTWQCSYL